MDIPTGPHFMFILLFLFLRVMRMMKLGRMTIMMKHTNIYKR